MYLNIENVSTKYHSSYLKTHSLMLAQQPIALQNFTSKLERKFLGAIDMFLFLK